MAQQLSFNGKRVLVTGGGRGLGKSIIKKFVEAGATVFTLDREKKLLDDLNVEFPNVSTIWVDLLNWDETRAAVEAVAPIDHLINNAGVLETEYFLDVTEDAVDRVLGVNYKALINVSQAVAKGIIERGSGGGTIVNITSMCDNIACAGLSKYCCSKAAATMLTKCMALELGEHGIRVNCVRPTLMKTKLVSNNESEVFTTAINNIVNVTKRQVIKRMPETSEVADSVLFLSSSLSSMITGTGILIDAGINTS